jgi:hypothetical protein
VTPRDPASLFYHDLTPADAKIFASIIQRHAAITAVQGSTTCAWRTIPSVYLICEDDRALPTKIQEEMVKACRGQGAPMEVERIFSSHSPFISKPDEVVSTLRRAAGEKI